MAKILYTVCGIGLGHASRSSAIIKELRKKHQVFIASYGAAYEQMKKLSEHSTQLEWFRLVFDDAVFSRRKTLLYNIHLAPYYGAKNFFRLMRMVKRFKPDIVVSDFDFNGLYVGEFFRLPVITISNMHLMDYVPIKLTRNELIDYVFTETPILKAFAATDYFIIPSFIKPRVKAKKAKFFYPVVREEVARLKPKDRGFILVYSSPDHLKKLIPLFQQLKNEKFVVYGMDMEARDRNIIYKKDSAKSILRYLKDCSAIISHGGISLLSEAVILKKPTYTFSSKNFFERYYNGAVLEKLGLGMVRETPDIESLGEFLSKLPKYKKALKRSKIKCETKEVVAYIDKLIRKHET